MLNCIAGGINLYKTLTDAVLTRFIKSLILPSAKMAFKERDKYQYRACLGKNA